MSIFCYCNHIIIFFRVKIKTINEIKNSFKFNDSIIRNLVLIVNKAHEETSALLTQTKEDNEKDSYQEAREAANEAVEKEANAASMTSEVSTSARVKSEEAPKEKADITEEKKEVK